MIFKKETAKQAHIYLDGLFNSGNNVDISKLHKNRSINQNRYMHGIVFTIFAVDLGWTVDEAKQYFKNKFLKYEKDGQTFVKETRKLNTKEMEDFLECCRVDASKEHGCYIPKPNEVTDEMWLELDKYNKFIK